MMHLSFSVLSLCMLTFVFFLLIPFASPLNFNLTKITNDTRGSINITGDAYISEKGIQVTPDPDDKQNASLLTWKAGRATYVQPLHLWDRATGQLADFNTHFSFHINRSTSLTDSICCGLAFFLAPSGSNIPNNSSGGRLGLTNSEGANPFVAVVFDTYRNNEWEPDLPNTHVGININSSTSVNYNPWYDIFNNGTTNDAWISYDSSSKNLSVVFTFVKVDSTVEKHELSNLVDLGNVLPEWVTFGFSASTGDLFEKNSIKSWEFNSTFPNIDDGKEENKTGLAVRLSVGSCALVVGLALVVFVLWKRKSRGEKREDLTVDPFMEEEFEKGTAARKFSYTELARATNDFAETEKLGEGGFGGVYRGFLRELNSYVAVKRISSESKQGLKEYATEVKIIGQLRHENLIRLIGWCHEKGELLIVYEFMPNGSLDSHLFKERSVLSWGVRYRVAQSVASALLYLHEEWEQCVVHRDIKSSNIMLDSDFTAKLGDFGLARLVDHGKGSPTTSVAGTIGYMAPEYILTWKASKETDVYSFGVVALEIACGRKPIDLKSNKIKSVLVNWIWGLYQKGKLLEAADQKLGGEFDEQEMERLMIVGLWCSHPDKNLRPSIMQAAQVLSFESPLPIIPSKMPEPTSFVYPTEMPTSSISSSSSAPTSSKTSQINFSNNSQSNISSNTTKSSTPSYSTSANSSAPRII